MTPAEYQAKVICDVFDALAKPKPAPKPDDVRRILIEIEIDVPVYVTEDRDDGISVTTAPVADWRVVPVTERLMDYICAEFESEITAEKNAEFEDRICGEGYDEDLPVRMQP